MVGVRLVRWMVIVGVVASALAPALEAQQTPTEGAVYVTNKLIIDNGVNGANSGGSKVFEATPTPPTSATDQKAYANAAGEAAAFETVFQWKATESFQLTGKVTAHFWVSCDVAAVYRPTATYAYRFTFQKNGATVGTANTATDATPVACTGPTSIREITIQDDTGDTAWKAGDTIGASLAFWVGNPPETAAKNFHFLVGGTKHPSQIHAAGLPLPGGNATSKGPQVVEETLNGTTAEVDHTFTNISSDLYRYNWTSSEANVTIHANVSVTNGSVNVRVRTPGGNESFNETFSASPSGASNQTASVQHAASGVWQIELRLVNATGRVRVTLGPTPAAPARGPGAPAQGTNSTANGTATTPAKGKSGIPGFEATVAAAAILAVFARRRRQ